MNRHSVGQKNAKLATSRLLYSLILCANASYYNNRVIVLDILFHYYDNVNCYVYTKKNKKKNIIPLCHLYSTDIHIFLLLLFILRRLFVALCTMCSTYPKFNILFRNFIIKFIYVYECRATAKATLFRSYAQILARPIYDELSCSSFGSFNFSRMY